MQAPLVYTSMHVAYGRCSLARGACGCKACMMASIYAHDMGSAIKHCFESQYCHREAQPQRIADT